MARILVVDDEEVIREMMHEVLQDYGFQVTSAVDPLEALCVLSMKPMDMIIVDSCVSKSCSGIDMLKYVRQGFPDLKILMVSSFSEYSVFFPERVARKLGVDGALIKPFNPEQLMKSIKELIL